MVSSVWGLLIVSLRWYLWALRWGGLSGLVGSGGVEWSACGVEWLGCLVVGLGGGVGLSGPAGSGGAEWSGCGVEWFGGVEGWG